MFTLHIFFEQSFYFKLNGTDDFHLTIKTIPFV